MPKKKYMTTQQYGMLLSELIETIQEAGDRVAPFFEKLDDVLKNDQLAQLPNEEWQLSLRMWLKFIKMYPKN